MISSTVTSPTTAALQEVQSSGAIFQHPLETDRLVKFAAVLTSKTPAECASEASPDFEHFMEATARAAGFSWKEITKRTSLHTALLYLFFRTVGSQFLPKFAIRAEFGWAFSEYIARPDVADLMHFANSLWLLSYFVEPKGNKQVFIAVASSLTSNFTRRYVTGGGQTEDTSVRVDIYRKLFNVPKTSRNRSKRLAPDVFDIQDQSSAAEAYSSQPTKRLKGHSPVTVATDPDDHQSYHSPVQLQLQLQLPTAPAGIPAPLYVFTQEEAPGCPEDIDLFEDLFDLLGTDLEEFHNDTPYCTPYLSDPLCDYSTI